MVSKTLQWVTSRSPVLLTLLVVGCLLALATHVALAQTSLQFDLSWNTTAGGDTSSSASFRVHGTVGQASARPPLATSASFALTGGFWAAESRNVVFLPMVVRG